jgi:PAS domain S-box-containing protein
LAYKKNKRQMHRAKNQVAKVKPPQHRCTTRSELAETLEAIRGGSVDAVVVSGPDGDKVYTLQGAEHPYRMLVEAMNEGAATLDQSGIVLYCNARFGEILGARLEKLIGSNLREHLAEKEQKERLRDLLEEGARKTAHGQIQLGAPDGRKQQVRFSLSPVKDGLAGLQAPAICVVATELTELVEANEALRANEEALRMLSARLLQLQDEERQRIARDLHDITGQKVAYQAMTLSHVLQGHANVQDREIKESLTECLELSQQVASEIRTLSYLLHPPLLDELGLSSAVQWYVQGFESRTGIEVKSEIPKSFPRLRSDVEVALFRVVQESLTNVHRYSGSTRARVRMRVGAGEVVVTIEDFGKGLRSETLKSVNGNGAALGVGIRGMRERLRQLSGRLDIQSPKAGGTIVTATIPASSSRVEATHESGSQAAQSYEANRPVSLGPAASGKSRILIADDHEVLRRGVRTMLETEESWEVCGEAVDGEEVVEKALRLNPDLVILDINMPVLNGLAALRKILQSRPETKVLVFSVHDSDQTILESQLAGAQGYVSKARASQDLLHAVKAVLAGDHFYMLRSAVAAH